MIWKDIKAWFHYNWNREHRALVREAFHGYPYDHGYLLDLEAAKLREMLAYHRTSRWESEEKRKEVIFSLELALRLLDIMQGRVELFTYHGELASRDLGKHDFKEIITDNLEYECFVLPNFRNMSRFVFNETSKEWCRKHPHELYLRKATHLYYAIREHYTESWWD